jgi:hypothetical protein
MARSSFDITEAARLMLASPLYGSSELTIVGGRFEPPRLADFLKAWQLPRPEVSYCLWETVREWTFARNVLPAPTELLERAEIFGEWGNVSLRCDGQTVRWHFVGPARAPIPSDWSPLESYWSQHGGQTFRVQEGRSLLWGKLSEVTSGASVWLDDRVGWAPLAYPHDTAERVEIVYTLLLDSGHTAFVWWKGLCNHAPGKD